VGSPLLLDEMFSDAIAVRLRALGHDVRSVVAIRELVSSPDDKLLARATADGRALVTANIRDFVPLSTRSPFAGRPHAGLILVSSKTFPPSRHRDSAIIGALAYLLAKGEKLGEGRVTFLQRPESS
jgi:Domain of unknown function (DUF5615)